MLQDTQSIHAPPFSLVSIDISTPILIWFISTRTSLLLPSLLYSAQPGFSFHPVYHSAGSNREPVSNRHIGSRAPLLTCHLANFRSISPRRSACSRGPSLRDRRT